VRSTLALGCGAGAVTSFMAESMSSPYAKRLRKKFETRVMVTHDSEKADAGFRNQARDVKPF
jgi:cellobiose-specific phosphotransferase system component IIB